MKYILEKLIQIGPSISELERMSRIVACLGIWQKFDVLRTADQPFDRYAFLRYLDEIGSWAAVSRKSVEERAETKFDSLDELESYTGDLYSKLWVAYDSDNFDDSVSFFEKRLRNNNFDLRFIAGAKCLDAGCGGGRYSIALHKLGAAHVTGVDIGIEAINDAKRRRDALSISEDKIQFQNQSVLELPPEWDATFDFMVSNGVLHHTTDPKKGLHELSRVLRPGGKLFIMLYGSDSLEWALTDYLRDLLTGISEGEVRSVLSILDLPVGKIFHIMDRWFVPNYELIPAKEFEKRAKAAGFSKCIPMHRGLYLYDGSERKWRFPEDADIVGEGEIRYIVEK